MPTYLIRKLEQFTRLSAADKAALARATQRVRQLGAREDVVREGDKPKHVNLMLEGFACRYKTLEDGRRQIVGFLVPGDLCDARMFILSQMDHSIATLSQARVAEIPGQNIIEATRTSERLARAFWWNSLVEESVSREWTRNIGQRTAFERMAHLLCELFVRLGAVGLVNGQGCDLPITQAELADALGLSTVHANRVLQELRAEGLIILKGKLLTIPSLGALETAAQFNSVYLHLDREGRELDYQEP